jgi:outer membrane receptor protein involved in Fe transport
VNGNLDLGAGWELFGRVNNLFDKRYGTAAALAENPFDSNGAFQNNSDNWKHETFIAPGAPRAAWLGIRYRFGK